MIEIKKLTNSDDTKWSFICPTWKTTITDETMDLVASGKKILKYESRTKMRKSEISLYFNYKAVLENIRDSFKEGIFLVFESDVLPLNNWPDMVPVIEDLRKNSDKWSLAHLGYDACDIRISPYMDTWTTDSSPCKLLRKWHTRCTDTLLWSYKGVLQMLEFMEIDPDWSEPMDYYFTDLMKRNQEFIHIWSEIPFFIQGSNNLGDTSQIQNDDY